MINDKPVLNIEDSEALLGYLRHHGHIGSSEQPAIKILAGGVSNRTVLVTRSSGEAWVVKQALAKLRVQVDWFSRPERMYREASGLRWLAQLAPRGTITPLIFEDHDHHLLAMQAVPQPHENWKVLLLAGQLETQHIEQFARLLGKIHSNAYRDRDRLASVFEDYSFFESLRLEPYYEYSATQVPEAADFLRGLVQQTRARRLTLVHGDFSPKNILVHRGKLILIDHEVIHWGDPAFDVGFSLTHLLSKANHLPPYRSAFKAAAHCYWQVYHQILGRLNWVEDLETYAIRHTLGCLLARIVGRSPLEYLSASERNRQRKVVLAFLIVSKPKTIPQLIDEFINRL